MRELSVFIDESGDFGESKSHHEYYLVSFVFHDQKKDLSECVRKLEKSVHDAGFDIEYVHTGPIIRREQIFKNYSLDERRKLLYKMLNFFITAPITHFSIMVNRKEAKDKVLLSGRLARQIFNELNTYSDFFQGFDKIIVYYDGGQIQLSSILNAVFSVHFSNVEFRKAEPQKYRLLQVADFICSMELLRIKQQENILGSRVD